MSVEDLDPHRTVTHLVDGVPHCYLGHPECYDSHYMERLCDEADWRDELDQEIASYSTGPKEGLREKNTAYNEREKRTSETS